MSLADPGFHSRERTLDLVRQAQQQSPGADDALVRRMSGRVYGLILLHMGPEVRRRCDPEDVLQEVWGEALRSLSGFDTGRGTPFGAWLATLVRRTLARIADGRRLEEPESQLASPASSRALLAQVLADSVPASPSMELSRRETVERLVAAIGRLPGEQREVAVAYWLEECTAEDVAQRLGKTRTNIYVMITRIGKVLADALQDAGGSDPARW
ncbi:MAG: sigma-70 family RNA polymerase sigma factor [Planctomycetota bacterium]|nr:MAG: sigma-70 family RNA polymerase sigma factor [Planctomycetota bacterium]